MYEESESSSPLIRLLWRAASTEGGSTLDAATPYWGLAFSRRTDGRSVATVAGPSLEPRLMDWRPGESYWGVEFEPHVTWRGLGKGTILGRLIDLDVEGGWCEVAGARIAIPDFDGLETFVDRLASHGIVVHEPAVAAALAGDDPYLSGRTLQRRFRDTTGLGRKQVQQMDRARRAYLLLQQGLRPADVAATAGYTDQAHLTRSLSLLAGQTPAQILAAIAKD